jgi:trehalose synthase-fused probable maltokinase
MTPEELASARWFRAKHRQIAGVREIDRVSLTAAGSLSVLEVEYRDGGSLDRYLVPQVDGREPADGEGIWVALAEAIADGARLGPFVAERGAEIERGPPRERRLRVEQSNTSVVIGERHILKLYRLVEPGQNPDLEVGLFLTDAGFADTPAVAGTLRYAPADREPADAVTLSAFVPSTGDAWGAMQGALTVDPSRATALAAEIGRLTARLHAALASRPDHPAFPARSATAAETAAWRASAERQLSGAVNALGGDAHVRLVAIAPAVRARFADTFGTATGATHVSRIHGDYHLGQLLARTDGGLSIIDFEGEPARPLAERRLPGSPMRDVAGMLRSLDYAARTVEREGRLDADAWLPEGRFAFLAAYGHIDPSDAALLTAFELEKACYEVRYEAANRPDWLWLPMAAVERLSHVRA